MATREWEDANGEFHEIEFDYTLAKRHSQMYTGGFIMVCTAVWVDTIDGRPATPDESEFYLKEFPDIALEIEDANN